MSADVLVAAAIVVVVITSKRGSRASGLQRAFWSQMACFRSQLCHSGAV